MDPLFPPLSRIHIIFPLAFLHFPQGDTPYSSIPLSQAWLVVGCWGAHISADSWPSALGPLVADARIFTFISSLWVRASGPQVLKTPVQSRCHWRVMSDNPTLSRVSPAVFCGWRTGCRQAEQTVAMSVESGDTILWAHTYLPAKDISGSSGACPGKGIRAHLNWDNPGSGYILWYYICQLTFSPCIYNYSTVPMHWVIAEKPLLCRTSLRFQLLTDFILQLQLPWY